MGAGPNLSLLVVLLAFTLRGEIRILLLLRPDHLDYLQIYIVSVVRSNKEAIDRARRIRQGRRLLLGGTGGHNNIGPVAQVDSKASRLADSLALDRVYHNALRHFDEGSHVSRGEGRSKVHLRKVHNSLNSEARLQLSSNVEGRLHKGKGGGQDSTPGRKVRGASSLLGTSGTSAASSVASVIILVHRPIRVVS